MAWEAVELVIAQGPGGKWQISTGGGRYPIWSSNGRELFLRDAGQPDHGLGLYRKRRFIRRGQTAPLVNMQIMDLFGTAVWNLDLTPDGKRFAVIPRPQPTGEQKGSVHLN